MHLAKLWIHNHQLLANMLCIANLNVNRNNPILDLHNEDSSGRNCSSRLAKRQTQTIVDVRTSVICSTQEITTLPTSTPLEGTPKRYRFVLFLNTILNHIPFFYLGRPWINSGPC